jgi:hypothetical protein
LGMLMGPIIISLEVWTFLPYIGAFPLLPLIILGQNTIQVQPS